VEQLTYEGIPVESSNSMYVEHYLPPTFPIEAIVTTAMMENTNRTWELLSSGQAQGMADQVGRSGVVLMYDEFYFRLFKRARKFEEIFPSVSKRAEVMLKGVEFLLALAGNDSVAEKKRIYYLGRAHRFKQSVRPWHFSVYAETFLETLMFWLGSDSNAAVGEAWTNLFAYTVKRMLQAFIVNRVIENEFYQNSDIDAVRKINAQSHYSKSEAASDFND
ncbi:unnamed protein product, partial [Heterosigma akashiwo]